MGQLMIPNASTTAAIAVSALFATVACGSSSDAGATTALQACNLHTGYDGDDRCLEAPAADKGMQFHYGPSDYSNANEVASYLVQPGTDAADCFYFKSPNAAKVFFNDFENSMRPEFHHLLVFQLPGDVAEGHRACSLDAGAPTDGGTANARRLIGGTSVARKRAGSAQAPEDVGMADYVEPQAQIEMQVHYFNTTDHPVLREVWMNIYFMDPANVTQVMEPIEGYGDVGWAIPPGDTQTWRSSMTAPDHLRMVDVYSHYHANTVRMSAWKVTVAGDRTKIYESYDWNEPGVLPLNSVDQNPAPDPTTLTTGGITGDLYFDKGDKLEWECEVHNTRQVILRYSNQSLDGEMCNVRGNYVPSLGSEWFGFDFGHQCTGPTGGPPDCPE